jgi:hypothetical protein
MNTSSKIFISAIAIALSIYLLNINESSAVGKAGCDAYMYVSNNSLFEINVFIDNVGVGNVMTGKNKTFTYSITTDSPKRVKVRCEYPDPDFIDPRAINFVTKTKVECGQTDTVYFGFAK